MIARTISTFSCDIAYSDRPSDFEGVVLGLGRPGSAATLAVAEREHPDRGDAVSTPLRLAAVVATTDEQRDVAHPELCLSTSARTISHALLRSLTYCRMPSWP